MIPWITPSIPEKARNSPRREIPDYTNWFATTFGPGAELAALYPEIEKKNEETAQRIAHGADSGGQVFVIRMPQLSNEKETEFSKELRQALKQPAIFYSVNYDWTSKKDGTEYRTSLGYFANIAGAYRRLDQSLLRSLHPILATNTLLGGNIQRARLITQVRPKYPEKARKKGISGTVRLRAIVAKDGTVKNLEPVSGEPLLIPAAMDAVKQWRYEPTEWNGQAVEVDTTIDVIFALNR